MEPSNVQAIFNQDTLFLVLKGMFVLAYFLYLAFAGVVVAQIRQMVKTLNGYLDIPLKLLGWIHLGIAGGALLLVFVIL